MGLRRKGSIKKSIQEAAMVARAPRELLYGSKEPLMVKIYGEMSYSCI